MKRPRMIVEHRVIVSPPVRGRGLKRAWPPIVTPGPTVAPSAGARIETTVLASEHAPSRSRPQCGGAD